MKSLVLLTCFTLHQLILKLGGKYFTAQKIFFTNMGFFPRANTVSLHSTSIIHHTGLRTWEYGLTIPYSKSYSICNILFVQLDDKKPFFHSGILIVQMQLPLIFRNKSKKSHTRLISQLFGAFLRPHLLITNKSTPVLILLSPNISGNPAVDMTMSMMTWKTG